MLSRKSPRDGNEPRSAGSFEVVPAVLARVPGDLAGVVARAETGEYEFRVKTENATKLSVNDLRRPLIDALVKSGSDTEYRGSIYLLGGRAYPIRLELSRAKEITSSIVARMEDTRAGLRGDSAAEPGAGVAAGDIRFDDRRFHLMIAAPVMSEGHRFQKRGTLATTDAAIEVAGYVGLHLKELSGVSDDASDREAKLREFCSEIRRAGFPASARR